MTVAANAVDRILVSIDRAGGGVGGGLSLERCACKLEQARVMWARGETDPAIRTAAAIGHALQETEMRREVADPHSRALLVDALELAGKWMATAQTEGTQSIIETYLRPAAEKAVPRTQQKRAAHLTLASFLSDLYLRRSERVKSEEMTRQVELLNQRKQQLEAGRQQLTTLAKTDPRHTAISRRSRTLTRELKIDEDAYTKLVTSIEPFLLEALRHFREALAMETIGEGSGTSSSSSSSSSASHATESGIDTDLGPVFQVVALWFEPANAQRIKVHHEMAKLVAQVPTYKFVPLIYQVRIERRWVMSKGGLRAPLSSTGTRMDWC